MLNGILERLAFLRGNVSVGMLQPISKVSLPEFREGKRGEKELES